MHFAGTRPWTMGWRFENTLDFCVWLLEHDGLRVPPFTAHPAAMVNVAGALTVDSWHELLVAVANDLEFTPGVPGRRWPHQLWRGDAAMGERLEQLWQDSYLDVSGVRKKRSQKRHGVKELFEELEPYRQYLPDQLRVELIDYPAPISWLCTSNTLLLSTVYDSLSDDEIKRMIFQTLDARAAESGASRDWKEKYWQRKRKLEPPWASLFSDIPEDQQSEWQTTIEGLRKSPIEVQNLVFRRYRLLIDMYRQGPRTGTIQSLEQLAPDMRLVTIKVDDVVFSTDATSIDNPDGWPLEIGQRIEVEVVGPPLSAQAIRYRLKKNDPTPPHDHEL